MPPEEWQNDVAKMEQLDDEALRKMAQEPVFEQQWQRHQELLKQNVEETLSEHEHHELEHLGI